ncbi:MAG TPA: protein phosphatase CheZ [Bacteroidota bacterium]|nr:protein phosphatase CheZ [Bacteroidota bacterium]
MKSAVRRKIELPREEVAPWPGRDVLDNFVKVVSEVVPLLDTVKVSLQESAGTIPKASMQLDNVTRATENATVEILDVLERMTARMDAMGSAITRLRESEGERESALKHIDSLIAEASGSQPGLLEHWKVFRTSFARQGSTDELESQFAAVRADAMSIAMALQVQDITSQQIAGVSQVIESVRLRLDKVLQAFGEERLAPAAAQTVGRSSEHFNGDAEYTREPNRQEHADEIVERFKRGDHA